MKIAVTMMTALAVASIALPMPASAASHGKQSKIPLQPGQQQVFFRADQIVGKSAQTPLGQKLGEIQEIVFNVDKGIYGIVKADNSSKSKNRKDGDRLVAIPWSTVTAVTDKAVVFNTSPQELANAPSFTDKEWSKMNDPQFTQRIDSHFKSTEMGGSEDSNSQSSGSSSSSESSSSSQDSTSPMHSTDSSLEQTGSSSGSASSTNSLSGSSLLSGSATNQNQGASSLESSGSSSGLGSSTNSVSGSTNSGAPSSFTNHNQGGSSSLESGSTSSGSSASTNSMSGATSNSSTNSSSTSGSSQ